MERVFEPEAVKGMLDEALRITAELEPKPELEPDVFRSAVQLVSMHRAAVPAAAAGAGVLPFDFLTRGH